MKVVIVGAGKLGYKIADSLVNEDIHVAVVDIDSKLLERISDHLDVLTVRSNGLEVETLKELDIKSYDVLIAVTDSDETNILVSSFAKKLGCKRSIARVRNPEHAKQIDFIKSWMGIDHIINPELATANEIARHLLESYTFYSETFARGRVSVIDLKVSSLPGFARKRIMDLKNTERKLEGLLIIAISRDNKIIIPDGSTMLQENDIIYVIGEKNNIDRLTQGSMQGSNIPEHKNRTLAKQVMILGGGKIGYYLANKLSSLGIHVKLIEQDAQRCEYLSEELDNDNTLVIHGDGTDVNLLEEEDLASMDAFIGVTGYDEENILMALMAKQAGVKKVIAKVSRPSYAQIVEKLGVDAALNPVDITASNILKFIRGGRVVSVSLLLGGQAEVTEFIASDKLPIIGKPLSKLGLPMGVIIGSIIRNGQVIIPSGNSTIQPGDRFVVFCLMSEVPMLKNFFMPRRGAPHNEL
ncbi:MAG: Trk system potassium transporter TrkA [Clostridiaceae bacterium]|nr:Trk system potassium transporter TrkA [Clostridiaceae bacterium]